LNKSIRPDIQALRAVAVLAVVIFHISPNRLIGGFMGVDVFFVISGYLMTLTIWNGVQGVSAAENGRAKSSFGFLFSFYAKRIRRLAPAATVLLLSVLFVVYLIGNFSLQKETAPQIFSSSIFIQNWFLADQAVDYFGADAGATAVQHFWSLSVEEQFYMIWPLLLLIIGLAFSFRNKFTNNINTGGGGKRITRGKWQFLRSLSFACLPRQVLSTDLLLHTTIRCKRILLHRRAFGNYRSAELSYFCQRLNITI
jgi:peptidoglycan/LPS O-acetylase OafA/YrhL